MPSERRSLRIVSVATNCLCYDQRVLKSAALFQSRGWHVTLAGRYNCASCGKTDSPLFNYRRFRMLFNKGFLFYAFFNTRLFFFLLFRKADIMLSNDLDTLPAARLASVFKNSKLIYDSHEFFTGLPELNGREGVKAVWKFLERISIRGADFVITVSSPIASLLEKEYGVSPLVVRNLSPSSDGIKPFSKKELGFEESSLVLIIQGTGINIDKGAEELVHAVSSTVNTCLIVAGSGDVVEALKEEVSRLGLSERVVFVPKLPWHEMMRYTKSADAGMVLEKDTNLNYRFSLPNKLFDYISAGIAVVAGNLPEIAEVVEKSGCGIIIPQISVQALSEALNILEKDREKLHNLKVASRKAFELYNWDTEKLNLADLCEKIENETGRN